MSKVEALTAEEIDEVNKVLEQESLAQALPFSQEDVEDNTASLNWVLDNIGILGYSSILKSTTTDSVTYTMDEPSEVLAVMSMTYDLAEDCGELVTGFLFHPLRRFACMVEEIDFYPHADTVDFMRDGVILCLRHMESCAVTINYNGFVRFEVKFRESCYAVLDWWV